MSEKSDKLIRISTGLHQKLTLLGNKSQSYNDLVQMLYDFFINHNDDQPVIHSPIFPVGKEIDDENKIDNTNKIYKSKNKVI